MSKARGIVQNWDGPRMTDTLRSILLKRFARDSLITIAPAMIISLSAGLCAFFEEIRYSF